MKKLILATIMLALTSVPAAANLQCGLKPLKPLGCQNATAACQCDQYGNCRWVWIGCD